MALTAPQLQALTTTQISALSTTLFGALSARDLSFFADTQFAALSSTNIAGLTYTNSGLADGTVYYFVVSATNSFGESPNSIEASAQTVSLDPVQLALEISGGSMQFAWPADHIGWRLEMQTNSAGMGLGTNWVTVPGSAIVNQASIAINPAGGSAFFRLVYP